MKGADIGGVIALGSRDLVYDIHNTSRLSCQSPAMTNDPFITAYITTRTLGMLFLFREWRLDKAQDFFAQAFASRGIGQSAEDDRSAE
ncbi:MAG: hypothetical protein ACLPT4_02595, partial [Verrucomicrobiia bacterium]